MSAGSGIIHQEMPQDRPEGIRGFQLWVNLPKAFKMAKPRYQDVRANTIPVIETAGARIRLITGALQEDFEISSSLRSQQISVAHHGELGPVGDVAGAPTYLDISLERGKSFEFPVSSTSTVLLYILDGTVLVGPERRQCPLNVIALTERLPELKLPERSDSFTESVRFLFIAVTPQRIQCWAWNEPNRHEHAGGVRGGDE